MPAQTYAILLLTVIAAAGLSVLAATKLGLPLMALSIAAVGAALVLRFRTNRR